MTAPEEEFMNDVAMEDVAFSNLLQGDADRFSFGIIGFDTGCLVQVYNRAESVAAGLAPERVLGQHLFETVAPCMNNFMVAQRFADALDTATPLDATIDYVLTLRMRPTPVSMRLLAKPGEPLRFLLIGRSRAAA